MKSNEIINFNNEQGFKIDNNNAIKNIQKHILLNPDTVYKRKFNSMIVE